jgi:hypothetical protein
MTRNGGDDGGARNPREPGGSNSPAGLPGSPAQRETPSRCG